jgi:hypothetical protein
MKTKIAKFFKNLTAMTASVQGTENPNNEEEVICKKADVEETMAKVAPNGHVLISAGICFIAGIIVGAVFSSNK